MDLFLEQRVRDLIEAAQRELAAGRPDAASEQYRAALQPVEDALSLDASNQTAIGLRRQLVEAMAKVEPARRVPPPSFPLIAEGDTPLFEVGHPQGGYLPEGETLSILDPKPLPEKPDYLPWFAAVAVVILVAISARVIIYYATRHVDLGPNPLANVQFTPPEAIPPAAPAQADDTIYFPDPGVTLPLLQSKQQAQGNTAEKVVLLAVIDQSGAPHGVKVVRGLDTELNARAMEAATKWRFRPGMRDGKPFPVMAQFEVNFKQ